MTVSSVPAASSVVDHGGMNDVAPRADAPTPRRSFTPQQKLEHLAAYEDAMTRGQGGAYLRSEGLYSSLISEWRKLRDAGMLDGKHSGQPVGKPSAEQAEIARLRHQLTEAEQKLETTETALEIMGKAHALLEQISKSTDVAQPRGKR